MTFTASASAVSVLSDDISDPVEGQPVFGTEGDDFVEGGADDDTVSWSCG